MILTTSLSDNLAEKLVTLLIDKARTNPLETAGLEVILPTRRACRTVREAFLRHSLDQSLLLPKLIPLYELDDLSVDIPPALPALERTLLLAKLCAAKSTMTTPDQALKIATSLGTLLDEFYQFETDMNKIADLVPGQDFAEHWNETLVFLNIIRSVWPNILAEKGVIDVVDRRIRLIDAYTRRLQKTGQGKTIIAAGLDGGLPVVRRLLKTIHDRGGLILIDGVDTTLTMSDRDTLPDHHYQHGVTQILKALQQDIVANQPESARESWITEALKPENKTEEWRHSSITPTALHNVHRLDCESTATEAVTIALLLREVLETPGKTAALVTPDRDLARRVILEMERWGVTLDDSAGRPLSQTDVGVYLNLLAQAALGGGKAADMLALLKHPLAADGKYPMSFRLSIKAAEKQARQGKQPFNPDLTTDLQPFFNLFQTNTLTPFHDILTAHIQVAEALATSSDRTGAERLWSDDAGQTALTFLTELRDKADMIGRIEPAFYPEMLSLLMSGLSVRSTYGMHPRLDILGPIEARFYHPDVCIIGGLNEGSFPGIPDIGPWLNRPMRKALNLPSAESKIATNAMDFAHCFCSPEIYLTRALKADGAETIPSRFLSRLEAVLEANQIPWPIESDALAKRLDTPLEKEEIVRPAPCPPVSARPNQLSVTKIELWMRNPYAIYARYILKLFPLDPLENNQKQQIFGSAIHTVLERFITEKIRDKKALMTVAEETFRSAGLDDVDRVFYLPRFEQMADFMLEQDALNGDMIADSHTEQKGAWTFDVAGKPFTLTGIADRIDTLKNGTARIIDYKTGGVPSLKEVAAGYAPQLPLEALILSQNGFPGIPAKPISELSYWKLASKRADCKITDLLKNTPTPDELIHQSFDGVKTLIHAFNQPDTPYEVCPIPGKAPDYNDYDHLSRSAEWIRGNDTEGDA